MDICKHSEETTDEIQVADYKDDSSFENMITSAFKLLDTSIEDASKDIKIQTTRMDRLFSLEKKVELKEKAVKEAKEQAATSGLDILEKVEALKRANRCAKETNDMLAREVYAQRAVLAKDLEQLQLRVTGVLNEGRRSLDYSDTMCGKLKRRLTQASTVKIFADKAKIEKERLAQEAHAFEESQMLKLGEELKRLKNEAVKNSKLQNLVKDRESAVDILLGNVSAKCQDVKFVLEHLDQPVLQLSGLLLSSQTVESNETLKKTTDEPV